MSQLTNNHEGSFDFPPKPKSPKNPPNNPQSSATEADDAHAQVISQARRDRNRAEELIASFDQDREHETSFISFADDDEQLRPGDFAAADPYVDTRENNNTDDKINADKNGSMEIKKAAAGLVGISKVSGDGNASGNKPTPTNLSTPPEIRPENAAEEGVRTVEDILSSIPGYETESETASAPVSTPTVEVAQAATSAAGLAASATVALKGGDSSKSEGSCSLSSAQPCNSPLNSDGEALVPVSWFAQAETEESVAEQLGLGKVETCCSSEAGTSFVSTSVDPVSGEKQFSVSDFSEMAEAKPQAIPNAYKDGPGAPASSAEAELAYSEASTRSPASPASPATEKIHSPVSGAAEATVSKTESTTESNSESALGTSEDKSDKPSRVTTITPVKSVFSSISSTGATAGAALAASLLGGSLAKSSSASETGSSTGTAATGNTNPLAKKAPPAPPIAESEITAALEKCDIVEPEPAAAEFSQETFGASGAQSAQETAPPESDETFLVDEGDVIRIDGNDGYDFIDLTCFERKTAVIKRDRIIVADENNPAFEVHFKNVQYVLFADNVRIDL